MKTSLTLKTIALILTLSALLMGSDCSKITIKDDNLCLSKVPYTGNELRTDGYYFLGDETQFFETCFFYGDGTYLNWGGAPSSYGNPFDFVEAQFTSEISLNRIRKSKSGWGVFEINGNDIKFVRWFCSDGVCGAFIQEGVIFNDTTFKITKSYRCDDSELRDKDELYHFKAFSLKPDSTNNFIK